MSRSYGSTSYGDDEPLLRESAGSSRVEFNHLSDSISSNLFSINNGASSLEQIYKQVGTAKDGPELRDRIHTTQTSTNALIYSTVKLIRQISPLSRKGEKNQKLQVERLSAEFQDTVQRYTNLQKQLAQKITTTTSFKTAPRPFNFFDEDNHEDKRPPDAEYQTKQKQMQQQAAQNAEFEHALMVEREQQILQIEADILDINAVFRDLGSLVHEQGEVINTIEEHIEKTYYDVDEGHKQLRTAADYQKKYRKKLCCFVTTVVIVSVVVAVILILTLRKK